VRFFFKGKHEEFSRKKHVNMNYAFQRSSSSAEKGYACFQGWLKIVTKLHFDVET